MAKLEQVLGGVQRCPHCSVATPLLARVWESGHGGTVRADSGNPSKWAAYVCFSCGGVVTAKGVTGDKINYAEAATVQTIYPAPPAVSNQLPETPRTFLKQAFETLHAPDAAAVMAGSAVDAMLKHLGLVNGTLYVRIDQALEQKILTQGMADWAHSVRLGSNRPRHADKDSPHVSPGDAKRSVDFAEALGNFLFVLTAQIKSAVEQVSTPDGAAGHMLTAAKGPGIS
ncbi:hypothetical protein BH10PSE12_BH10PSE12_01900 [soil metagenome]